jgi:hypothetical protein
MAGFEPGQKRDSKGRWTKSGAGLAAATVAGVVVFGGAGGGAGVSSVESAAGQGMRAKTSSKDAAKKGQRDEAWKRAGFKRLKQTVKNELVCGPHSFGQVREFFLRTPCRSLDRIVVALGDSGGNTVVVSVAWVRMPRAESAEKLKKLVDVQGTGNVEPLGGALLGLAGVDFTGKYYDSRRDGSLVVIAESTPGGGHPSGSMMSDLADVAAELPKP